MSPVKFLSVILTIVLLIAGGIVHQVSTAAGFPGEVLPSEIVSGWVMDGGIRHFSRDNLFDHINGEAEIYLPYGFEDLASARYADKKNERSGILADVYKIR